MKISVIVPTYNRKHQLEQSLEALTSMDYPEEKYEIIVVNDISGDGTKRLLQEKQEEIPNLKPVNREGESGIGSARNAGLEKAQGEYIFFTDDDCLVPEDWFQLHFEQHEKHDVDVVNGVQYPVNMNWIEAYKLASHWQEYQGKKTIKDLNSGSTLKTNNLSLKKEILDDVGYFNEELARGEDTELGKRILKNGYTILKDPELQVEHLRVDSLTDLLKTQYKLGKSLQLLNRLHEPVEIERTSDKNYLLEAWKEYYGYVGLTKSWIFPIIAFASTTTRRLSQRGI